MFPEITNCQVSHDTEKCINQHPGHMTHMILVHLATDTPKHWRDYLVSEIEPNDWVTLEPFGDGPTVRIWHHEPLSALLSPGDPVSLHPVVHLLLIRDRPLNVALVNL